MHICQYCKKEFIYPSKLKQHLSRKTPCNKNFFFPQKAVPEIQEIFPQYPIVPEISPQCLVIPEISQQYSEKNMVPIRLCLA